MQKNNNNITSVEVNVYIYWEDGQYTAYCPALELASAGKSVDEAFSMFKEALSLYLEETNHAGTLHELGWTLITDPKPKYNPPNVNVDNLRSAQIQTTVISLPA